MPTTSSRRGRTKLSVAAAILICCPIFSSSSIDSTTFVAPTSMLRRTPARGACCSFSALPAKKSSTDSSGSPDSWGAADSQEERRVAPRVSKTAALFRKNGGVLYVRNFLEPGLFGAVKQEAAALKKKAKPERSSFARGRTGAYIPRGKSIEGALFTPPVATRVQELTGLQNLNPSEYPLELRVYTPGAEMEWHSDELLFDIPQVEFVYTVSNDGDSHTEWQDPTGKVHDVWAEPNSMLLIQAGAAPHRVRKMKRGERVILKGIFSLPGAEKLPAFFETQGQF